MRPTVVLEVRALAAKGYDAAAIRNKLRGAYKLGSISDAIMRVREQGDLPPKVKAHPDRIVILLKPRAARQLEELAAAAEMRPSQFARTMIQRAISAQPTRPA